MNFKLAFLVALAAFIVNADELYSIPRPTFEVFRPRGFRVSIPDSPGIRMFSFHGAVNRKLHGLENGDLAEEVLKKTGNSWVYNNKLVKLEEGNIVNFWMMVIKGQLGYRIDDQQYIVTAGDIKPAPPGFFDDKSPPPLHTTPRPSAYPTYVPKDGPTSPSAPTGPRECNCDEKVVPIIPQASSIPGHIPLTCYLPNDALSKLDGSTTTATPIYVRSTTTTTTTTTEKPEETTIKSSTTPVQPPPDLGIWRDLLTNLSMENKLYQDRIRALEKMNHFLANKLVSMGDENMNKLVLSGRIPRTDDPMELVKTVFKEKLGLTMTGKIRSAVRNADGSITFDMATLDDKYHVLLVAEEKLHQSRISISDISTVSFMDQANQRLVDQRMQNIPKQS